MTDTTLLDNPRVKQTLTAVDEKYWYQFGWKVERHTVHCIQCKRIEVSTKTYKVFAHYLYTPHTLVTKYLPYSGVPNDSLRALPVHFVDITSEQSSCSECVDSAAYFSTDADYRTYLKQRAGEITAAARRDNELRVIFGGPPKKVQPSSGEAKPKVTLADFMKGFD